MSYRAAIFRKQLRAVVQGADATVEQQRRSMNRVSLPLPRSELKRDITVGGVPSVRVEPRTGAAHGHLLYLHGGGYCLGSPRSHAALAARLAKGAGMSTTVLDYRLAPEHVYPAGLDDCLAAYTALLDEFPADSLTIAGDSAGGGATIATLQRIRDRGLSMPAAAVVFSPWVDLTGNSPSMAERAGRDPMLRAEHLTKFGTLYRGPQTADHHEVSPLFGDLGGLCPVLVQVGSEEILFDNSALLVERITAAGGQAQLEVSDGMWHVFQIFAPMMPEAQRAVASAARFLVRHSR